MKTAYLGLGSNLGDRRRHLEDALAGLAANGIEIVRRSSLYETEPQMLRDQPWFLNLVVEARTDLFPMQLLARTRRIEAELGRQRTVAKGPRTVDIDILLFGNVVMNTPRLTIPHPGLAERRFVLEPLLEIAPELRHPVSGKPLRELLGQIEGQTVLRAPPGPVS